jgi:hypothetical protein
MRRQELTGSRPWPRPVHMEDEWPAEEPEVFLWKDVAVASAFAVLLGVLLLFML